MLGHRAGLRLHLQRLLAGTLALWLVSVMAQDSGLPEERAIQAPLATRSLLLDGIAVDKRLVVVGERGHILVSRDDGDSWTQAEVPTRATLTGVYFHDAERGWAVGHDAVILRTLDGGDTWEKVHAAPEEERPLLDVWFENAEHGFAIGAYGYFLETRDAGTTWQARQISQDDFHLNQIAAASNGRLYIAAEAGIVYRSDDGGESWTELPSPYEGSFFGSLPLDGDGDAVLLFGLRGRLFRSEDAGDTWMPVQTDTEAMLTSALRLDADSILITGMSGTLLLSKDQGRDFVLHQQEDRLGIAQAMKTGRGDLVLVGEFGVRKIPEDHFR